MSERYNATVDLLERNVRKGRDAAAPYLVTPAAVLTYDEVVAMADGVGAGLLESGLSRGDRVLILTQDCPELVATFWGAIKAGLVAVPVAPMLSLSELQLIVADSEARAVIYDGSAERSVAAADLRGAVPISLHASASTGARRWSEVCGGQRTIPGAPTTPTDSALWLYTSGTTGTPKAVPHSHASLRAAPAGLSSQVARLSPSDVVLSASRMFFAYGLGNSVHLAAAAGASVVTSSFPVTAASTQGLIDAHAPTIVFGVPSFFEGFVRMHEANLGRSVRLAFSAGEALGVELFDRFKARFGIPLLDGWGCTEALHHVTANRPDDAVAGSAGRALEGYDVQVRDRSGTAVSEGTSGELWIRGPTLFAGYWRRPELTSNALRDGWFRTGDIVQMKEGRLYHEGRFDDLLKLGGIWVSPIEIEDVLRSHNDVEDAVVVMTNTDAGIPILRAFVRATRTDAGLHKELAQTCRLRLASYKVPRAFETVTELPRTPTGKLRRFELRSTAGTRKAGSS